MSERERKAEKVAILALALAIDAQRKLHRRDRWKRKLGDALWPFI